MVRNGSDLRALRLAALRRALARGAPRARPHASPRPVPAAAVRAATCAAGAVRLEAHAREAPHRPACGFHRRGGLQFEGGGRGRGCRPRRRLPLRRVLITGGAGFIGSHLAEELLRAGDEVRVLDPLVAQVHEGKPRPDYLDPEVELQVGDVRDPEAVDRALHAIDAVVHLAARIGVGQSMYEIADYTAANTAGTGVLLQALVRRPVGRVIVASSMSVYGEGLYADENGLQVVVPERSKEQLARQEW